MPDESPPHHPQPSPRSPDLDPDAYSEPAFNLRHGLRILLIVGIIVTIISVFCIWLDGRYG